MALKDTLSRDNDPLAEAKALREHINAAVAVRPPRGLEQQMIYRAAKLWFRPRLFNTERLPDRPCLFIGNHAVLAMDGFVILPVLLEELGRFLRPMGDRFLFSNPKVARMLLRRGGTMGHPDVARALMTHDQDILVFPGGAHEAVKASRDRYTLQWKDRIGFLRLAAEFGYTIVPFGLVGPDDFYEYLLDSEDIVALLSRVGLWRKGQRTDAVPPLLRGAFGSVVPRPKACYLSFGEPLELPAPGKRAPGRKRLYNWRSIVAERIETEISAMLLERERDRSDVSVLRRLATI